MGELAGYPIFLVPAETELFDGLESEFNEELDELDRDELELELDDFDEDVLDDGPGIGALHSGKVALNPVSNSRLRS